MSPTPDTILSGFERAALAARQAEDVFRKQAALEIGRLEADRQRAYRRVRLIGLLETAASDAAPEQDKLAAQRRRLCHELGWNGDAEPQRQVLDRLNDVCRAVQPAHSTSGAPSVLAQLETFERWFFAERKTSFYALFDQYVQETPVVDF